MSREQERIRKKLEENPKEKYKEYLLSLVEWLNNQNIDSIILEKVFALKIKMLRKSMISGTSTLNRTESADSLHTLNGLNPTPELERLTEGEIKWD